MSTFGKVGARPLMLKNTGEYAEEQMYKELFKATVGRTGIGTGHMDLVGLDIQSIGRNAYSWHRNIGTINLPTVTAIGQNAFDSAIIYGDISLPSLTTSGYRMFSEMHFYGAEIRMPNLVTPTGQEFYQALQSSRVSTSTWVSVYLDSVASIGNNMFYNCTGMALLYAPRVASISGTTAFTLVGNTSAVGPVSLIVGSRELGTGMTTAGLTASTGFPFGASTSGRVKWTCKDGTVTYDTSTSSWVQTPYT